MSQLKFNTKKQLQDALEARRGWAQEYDRRVLGKHREDEHEFLVQFRARCRELAKMNLKDLKQAFEAGRYKKSVHDLFTERYLPGCPVSAESRLDHALKNLEVTRQEKFVLDSRGRTIQYAHWLLTAEFEQEADKRVC